MSLSCFSILLKLFSNYIYIPLIGNLLIVIANVLLFIRCVAIYSSEGLLINYDFTQPRLKTKK